MTPNADPFSRSFDTILYDSPILRAGKFRAVPEHPRFHDSGPANGHIFVFPRTLVRIQHEGAESFVAGPDVVTYYNRGQVYHRDSVGGRPDRCEWFAFAPHVLRDALRRLDPGVDEHPDRPFTATHGPSEPVAYMRQRRVVDALSRGERPDALEIEETLLSVLSRVLEAGARVRRRMGCDKPSARRERSERDLAEAARIELGRFPQDRRTLDQIAGTLETSVFHLCRVFRRQTGSTLHQYRNRLRLAMALELLASPDGDLTQTALAVGFSSHSHFTASFRAEFGVVPSRFRESGPGGARRCSTAGPGV